MIVPTMYQATGVAVTALDWALSPLVGISQIFVVENAVSGALVLGGIAVYSKEAAAHTLLGSSIGVATGVAMGADPSAITAGLWGFNPALTSLAVSVFFTPSCAFTTCQATSSGQSQHGAQHSQCCSRAFVRSWYVLPICRRRGCHICPSRRDRTYLRCVCSMALRIPPIGELDSTWWLTRPSASIVS